MRPIKSRIKRSGQALVETALLIMLLFFLLSAAFDLGMMFFAYQGIANAALEGASYGSLYPAYYDNGTIVHNDDEIRLRVRNEPALVRTITNVRFVNIKDLNSDGGDDDAAVLEQYILIEARENAHGQDLQGAGLDPNCASRRGIEVCDLFVTVKFTYRPFFVLAPALGIEGVNISATRSMTIRDVSSPDPTGP